MAIKIDLQHIKMMGIEREEENFNFRAYLKMHDLGSEEIDAIVHRIADEVVPQIDCTKCANCCKQIKPVLDKDDVSKFARGLNISVSEFKKKYLAASDEQPAQFEFNKLPCPFLKNDQCSNYEYRPKDCRSYPHLHKKDFVSRLFGVIDNYEICPIVFHAYEKLKTEL